MSDQDLISALGHKTDNSDAEAFLGILKQAGAADLARETAKFVRAHTTEIAAALVGAAALAGGQYLATKPGKNGRSADQAVSDWAVKSTKKTLDEDKAAGRDSGFSKEMAHATAVGGAGVSKVMTKHPGKAALLMAPVGASLGLTAAQLLKSQIFK
jgi:hypothetical protein